MKDPGAQARLRSELVDAARRMSTAEDREDAPATAHASRFRIRRLASGLAVALTGLVLAAGAAALVLPNLDSGSTPSGDFTYTVTRDNGADGKLCLRVRFRQATDASGRTYAGAGGCGRPPSSANPIAVTINGPNKLFGIVDDSVASLTVDGEAAELRDQPDSGDKFFVAPLAAGVSAPDIIAKDASGNVVASFPPAGPCGAAGTPQACPAP